MKQPPNYDIRQAIQRFIATARSQCPQVFEKPRYIGTNPWEFQEITELSQKPGHVAPFPRYKAIAGNPNIVQLYVIERTRMAFQAEFRLNLRGVKVAVKIGDKNSPGIIFEKLQQVQNKFPEWITAHSFDSDDGSRTLTLINSGYETVRMDFNPDTTLKSLALQWDGGKEYKSSMGSLYDGCYLRFYSPYESLFCGHTHDALPYRP